jgi:hypothetical protein
MQIVGPSFIFNIFLSHPPASDLHQPNFPIFKNLTLRFPMGFLSILY